MPSPHVELAQLKANLAKARLRLDHLGQAHGHADHLGTWGGHTADEYDVQILQVEAEIVALEERRAELEGAPANDVAPVPAQALEKPAATYGEYVDTKTAATILGVSTDTLERLRAARKQDPPWQKIGRLVRYPVAGLHEHMRGRRG